MYDALSVAHYIIDYCNERGRGISNLKLQKILYFVQAEFLVSTPNNTPCFKDGIEAWDFGPVVPSVYHQYKLFGSANIPAKMNDVLVPYYEDIASEDQLLINSIVDGASKYTASQLVQITHNQAPWKNAYRRGSNNVITNRAILDYFRE